MYLSNFPKILLHGSGINKYDELILFVFIIVIILTLLLFSWKVGRDRERLKNQKKRSKK